MTRHVPGESARGHDALAARRPNASQSNGLWAIAMMAAFVCVVGLLGYRASIKLDTAAEIGGKPVPEQWGLADFRDNFYYPVVSFLEGQNPYDREAYMRTYPVVNGFPLYLPLTLVVYLPFGLLALGVAQVVHFGLTLVLTLVLAVLTLRLSGIEPTFTKVFGLGTLMLLSRPGHWNLVLGNCAVLAVVGIYLALLYGRDRPWIAGLGLALSTFKPTFGFPAAILMLAMGDVRTVVIGLSVAGALSAGVSGVIIHQAGGITEFVNSIQANYAAWQTVPVVSAASNAFRVDIVGLAGRFIGRTPATTTALFLTAATLGIAAAAIRRAATSAQAAEARRLSSSLLCVSVLLCTYHQAYDLLLLALPLTALVSGNWAPAVENRARARWLLVALLGLPAANYLASGTAMTALGISGGWRLAVTSLNGVALVIALFIYAGLSWTQSDYPKRLPWVGVPSKMAS